MYTPIRCMTDMAAAGPEFFSPVPELLRKWCFPRRYVDICGILVLTSVLILCCMCEVAHWLLFVLMLSFSSDSVLPLALSMPDIRGDCVTKHFEIVSAEGLAPSERDTT